MYGGAGAGGGVTSMWIQMGEVAAEGLGSG